MTSGAKCLLEDDRELLSSPILSGSVGSLLAGLATADGALPLLGLGSTNERRQGLLLGFAAGVMLGDSLFSLMVPAFDAARAGGLAVSAGSLAVIGLKRFGMPLVASARSSGDAQIASGCSSQRSHCTIYRKGSLWV